MIKLTCAACGRRSNRLSPCPCELGDECPAPLGVCPSCWAVVQANVVDRARELRRGVQSRALAENASRAGPDERPALPNSLTGGTTPVGHPNKPSTPIATLSAEGDR